MNLDDDSNMDDLLIRGEQARRKRSHKKRRLMLDEVADDINLRLETQLQPQQNKSSSNWFKEMISYPCTKKLSLVESFSLWSAILLYLPTGLFVLINPEASSIPVREDNNNIYTRGYQRICGIHTIVIAFLYVIFSRATGSNSFKGVILGTMLIRTVYASACMYLLYIRQYISMQMVYTTLAIDAGLSFITFILWFFWNPEASLKNYFKAIWQLINPSYSPSHSSNMVQILGFIQCILGMFFFVFPNLALQVFQINPKDIHGYSKGWLSIGFMSSAAIGFIHVLSGGADSRSYNTATVFYRIIFSISVVTCLGLWGQIPCALGLYYISLDGFCASVTFIALCRESVAEDDCVG